MSDFFADGIAAVKDQWTLIAFTEAVLAYLAFKLLGDAPLRVRMCVFLVLTALAVLLIVWVFDGPTPTVRRTRAQIQSDTLELGAASILIDAASFSALLVARTITPATMSETPRPLRQSKDSPSTTRGSSRMRNTPAAPRSRPVVGVRPDVAA